MSDEYGLIPVLRKQSTVWHLEVYGQPFCQNPHYNNNGMVCELDLSLWNNETLTNILARIESVIGVAPVLVKGKCPHTKLS